MRLWVSAGPRKLRFYDLRHTHATLLRKAGGDLGAVQRALGHSSPEITAATYDHSDLEDFREHVDGRSRLRWRGLITRHAGCGKPKS